MSNKNNEMIPVNTGFLALADFNMNEGMAEELDGLEGGFDRVKIPAGGVSAPVIKCKKTPRKKCN